jgi:hypothetical protein
VSSDEQYTCPHCDSRLSPWRSPDLTTWGGRILYVCFNDDCSYFQEGWDWMWQKYNVKASYRHRFDPESGDTGPLSVWSSEALKEHTDADATTDQNDQTGSAEGSAKEGPR